MVTKNTIKAYDFETLGDYYQYIIDSNINGQHGQVKNLISKFSKIQKKEFLYYLEEWPDNKMIKSIRKTTIELL
jgi:hypothetical protein